MQSKAVFAPNHPWQGVSDLSEPAHDEHREIWAQQNTLQTVALLGECLILK
jgi:hypothetical protein